MIGNDTPLGAQKTARHFPLKGTARVFGALAPQKNHPTKILRLFAGTPMVEPSKASPRWGEAPAEREMRGASNLNAPHPSRLCRDTFPPPEGGRLIPPKKNEPSVGKAFFMIKTATLCKKTSAGSAFQMPRPALVLLLFGKEQPCPHERRAVQSEPKLPDMVCPVFVKTFETDTAVEVRGDGAHRHSDEVRALFVLRDDLDLDDIVIGID